MTERNTVQSVVGRISACAFFFWLAGCASLPEVYVPERIGRISGESEAGRTPESLVLTITADQHEVLPGDPVVFRVRIVNRSDGILWIPRNPDVLFLWIYPDGNRDNHVRDVPEEKYYRHAEMVRLEPGWSHATETQIRTDFFPRTGIVEFRAVLILPHNTNPLIAAFPEGRFYSNRYGVYVGRSRRSLSHDREVRQARRIKRTALNQSPTPERMVSTRDAATSIASATLSASFPPACAR